MIAINNNLALKTFGHVTKNVGKVTMLYLATAAINKQLKQSTGEISEIATQGFRIVRAKFER